MPRTCGIQRSAANKCDVVCDIYLWYILVLAPAIYSGIQVTINKRASFSNNYMIVYLSEDDSKWTETYIQIFV